MYSDVFCKVYNEFGWNYYPEVFGQQLLTWLQRHQQRPETALDLGCGTGVLCEILQGSGIRTTGMDLSSGMIQIARQGDPNITYEVGNMITYCPDRQFDLVTCTGDALNHIRELEDLDIVGMVRAQGLSMEEFAKMLRYMQPNQEVTDHENYTQNPGNAAGSDYVCQHTSYKSLFLCRGSGS